MRVSELKREMDEQFALMRAEMNARFASVDQRFASVDQRFEQVDRRFDQVEARILEEAETTRRHFNVVAERLEDRLRLALEMSSTVYEKLARAEALNAAAHDGFVRLMDNHDARLNMLERE